MIHRRSKLTPVEARAIKWNADGSMDHDATVEAARPKGAPLHDRYPWNAKKALQAQQKRASQDILRCYYVYINTTSYKIDLHANQVDIAAGKAVPARGSNYNKSSNRSRRLDVAVQSSEEDRAEDVEHRLIFILSNLCEALKLAEIYMVTGNQSVQQQIARIQAELRKWRLSKGA